jgi:hypothetical protein
MDRCCCNLLENALVLLKESTEIRISVVIGLVPFRVTSLSFFGAMSQNEPTQISTHFFCGHSGFAFFALKKIVIPMYDRYIGTPVWVLCRAA